MKKKKTFMIEKRTPDHTQVIGTEQLKMTETETLNLLCHNMSRMQEISQGKGVTRYLDLQNNFNQQIDNDEYRNLYYQMREVAHQFIPTLEGLRKLVNMMNDDIGEVANFKDSVLSEPATFVGLNKFADIATFLKERREDFSPLKAKDLLEVIKQQELINLRKIELMREKQI